jgi:UDP-N-acetylmuramoyl-tripeptide--D-alanyl-D-alanine ligase
VGDIPLTAAWVAEVMAGTQVAGAGGLEFAGVSIDTRTLARGELFIAIRGEHFDGTDFAEAAIERGATGLVVPRGRSQNVAQLFRAAKAAEDAVVIEVDDTVAALQGLATAIRRASGAKVVAITGSAGKTTTKEVTAELLATRYRVVRNKGNLNNHIGLPLSLVDLRQRPDIAVVELGMNHAGEISTLVRIAEPDARVWTNVGEAHVGFFGSVNAIADAKAEILERASGETLLVANADDTRIANRLGAFAGRVRTFGIERAADVRATDVVDRGIDGTTARITTPRGSSVLTTPLIGRGNLANVLAATAVALEYEVALPTIVEKAAQLRPAVHRGEVIRLGSGVIVIDDSYNASPTATKRALEVLAATAATRRVAVLGEMLELGGHASDLHAEIGRAAAAARLDALFVVGGAAAETLAAGAVAAGMGRSQVRHFGDSVEAGKAVVDFVQAGDVVLVKGSRGVKTDRVVERLRAERA